MSSSQPELTFARNRGLATLPRSALILVDFQRIFLDSDSKVALPGATRALANARRLLNAFHRASWPIVVTRHAHRKEPSPGGMGSWWTQFLWDGDPTTELAEELQVPEDALVLRKEHYSAFRNTRLESWIRNRGARNLVLAGVMTHVCVDSTARDAFQRGFDILLVEDACASKDARLHEASLLTLSHAVAKVASTKRVLAVLQRLAR